jgi:hypothetical protein
MGAYTEYLVGTIVLCLAVGVVLLLSSTGGFRVHSVGGSPPVNSSHSDLIMSLLGIVPGLVLGGLAWNAHRYSLGVTTPPSTPGLPVPAELR